MWTRELIKNRAKDVLRENYWKAFGVSIVLALAGSTGNSGNNINERIHHYSGYDYGFTPELIIIMRKVALFLASIALILLVLRVFIGYMLEVGGRKFFIRASEGESNMNYLVYCFNNNRYLDVLVTMLLRSIYTILWTLLFIIPGIVKSYAYRMVPYILADNPNIGHSRAIKLSNEMTKGEKWDIFVLDLSFIGWFILGALALMVGTLFVLPYYNATNAELYLTLRKGAIERGLTSKEELNIL